MIPIAPQRGQPGARVAASFSCALNIVHTHAELPFCAVLRLGLATHLLHFALPEAVGQEIRHSCLWLHTEGHDGVQFLPTLPDEFFQTLPVVSCFGGCLLDLAQDLLRSLVVNQLHIIGVVLGFVLAGNK